MTAVQAGLYDTDSLPQLAQSLAAAKEGDAKGLFSLADSYTGRLENGSYSNLLDANLAINCADTEQTVEESEIRRLATVWNEKYPLFGAGSAVGLYTCGHPAAGRRGSGAGPRQRRPADLAGRRPHGLSEDPMRHPGGGLLPRGPEGASGRPDLSCMRLGGP